MLANDNDLDGDTLSVDQVAGNGANVGTVVTTAGGAHVTINADGSLTYNPNGQFDALTAGQDATDTLTYRATDGGLDDTATITFTINGVNDTPDAVDDVLGRPERRAHRSRRDRRAGQRHRRRRRHAHRRPGRRQRRQRRHRLRRRAARTSPSTPMAR